MRPYSEDKLTEVVDRIRGRSPVLADITLIAGWTGLRWGELRAVRVGDLQELPSPGVVIMINVILSRLQHAEAQRIGGE